MNNTNHLLKAASILDEAIEMMEAREKASKSASELNSSGFILDQDTLDDIVESHGSKAPDAIDLAADILKNQPQKAASIGSPLTYEGNESGGSASVSEFDSKYLSGGIS